jgi:hypothetical protein
MSQVLHALPSSAASIGGRLTLQRSKIMKDFNGLKSSYDTFNLNYYASILSVNNA